MSDSRYMRVEDVKVRVRFAPSPTGALHIGGVRTALFNYLFAKRFGGDFILRVEDTDSKREVDGAVDYINDAFDWLGIKPNEGYGIGGDYGPYIQSERKDIYKKHVEMLVESGHAYYAFDTPEELNKMREDLRASGFGNAGYTGTVRDKMKNSLSLSAAAVKEKLDSGDPYVVRFNMPRREEVKFKDEVRDWVTFNTKDLDDKVIWKSSDGLPTYHLANVVDDHLMEITHVIRGEEWVSSTPLHVLLYRAFGWEHPVYAHLPLILGPDGKKIGKRDAEKYGILLFPTDWNYVDPDGTEIEVKGFREAGYEPDALVNFLALLGWNPGDDKELMSVEETASLFGVDRINKAGAKFDMKKLKAFNSYYLGTRDKLWIFKRMNIPSDGYLGRTALLRFGDDKLDMLAKMATERATLAEDLSGSMDYIFVRPALEDFKTKNVEEFESVMIVFIDKIVEIDWFPDGIRDELESVADSMDIKVGKVMPLLRGALADGKSGPQLPDIMYILGPEETELRIKNMLGKLKEVV